MSASIVDKRTIPHHRNELTAWYPTDSDKAAAAKADQRATVTRHLPAWCPDDAAHMAAILGLVTTDV